MTSPDTARRGLHIGTINFIIISRLRSLETG